MDKAGYSEAGPSREEEEEEAELTNEAVTTRSLSLRAVRDVKRLQPSSSEHVVSWLLRCWDDGARRLELEGREAKQLGSLAREGGIDKAIGKGAQALSLWRRLLSRMKKRCPFKEDAVSHPGKWSTTVRSFL